jgi:hypothetical protein
MESGFDRGSGLLWGKSKRPLLVIKKTDVFQLKMRDEVPPVLCV